MSKDKDKNPQMYYREMERQEARMHRLVALRLKNAILSNAYYTKGQPDDGSGWGLFDIVDPAEEADMLIADLRFFGFIPDNSLEPTMTEKERQK